MRTLRFGTIALLISVLAAGSALAQHYPGDRTTERNRPTRNQRQPQRGPTTEGPARAPDGATELPENRQPIPPATDAGADPDRVEDGDFARAIRAAAPGAIVHINLPDGRRAVGFLIKGKDEEHKLVITSFLGVARTDYNRGYWVDVRLAVDWSRLEVEGLLNYDELQDLALISVKAPKNRSMRTLELASKDPKKGTKAYAVGFWPAKVDWAVAGEVLKLAPGTDVGAPAGSTWIETDAIITGNNRGGPLLDRHGKVIGLCVSSGRMRRGPHLAVPVSKIRDLVKAEPFGSGRFPAPQGAFRWPESKDKRKTETFSYSRIYAAANAIQRSLDCKKCKGHGYLVAPVYRTDRNTGKMTKTGEKREVCEECGGAGVIIKPSIHELLSSVTRALLNPDEKIDDGQKAKLTATAREGFDRAAVNRLVLADSLTPAANRILEDIEGNRGKAVTFLATLGPTVRGSGRRYQWVRSYESGLWLVTQGANVRGATGSTPPPQNINPRFRRRWEEQQRRQAKSSYVLVSGIVQGITVFEDHKNIYQAPMLRVSDIVHLRP